MSSPQDLSSRTNSWAVYKERHGECGICQFDAHKFPYTLGAKGHLPSGHIVSLLWVLKQFAWQIPTGQIMGSFKKYPPQYPVGTL